MGKGLDPTILLMDEGEPSPGVGLTDLGLDGISSTDLLGFGLCLFLSLFALKIKSFPFVVVSAIAWMVVGFQVAGATASPIIMLLVLAIAAGMLTYGAKFKGW